MVRMQKHSRKATSGSLDIPPTDTRTRIKVAARRLFAERGVEAVTVRDIVAAAGARNGGSLNYYFGTKDELVYELVEEILHENTEELLKGISAMERNGGPKSVHEIVSTIITSYKTKADPTPNAHRFLSSVLSVHGGKVRKFLDRTQYLIYFRLLEDVIALKPEIPPEVLRQRWIFWAWYVISARSAYETYLAEGRTNPIWTDVDPIANIIDTSCALLEAPVSQRESALVKSAKRPSDAPV